jgi:hypothetical protein
MKIDVKFCVKVHVAPGKVQLQALVNRMMDFVLRKKKITFS